LKLFKTKEFAAECEDSLSLSLSFSLSLSK
jgi:hypothetical protein